MIAIGMGAVLIIASSSLHYAYDMEAGAVYLGIFMGSCAAFIGRYARGTL